MQLRSDTPAEMELIRQKALEAGADAAVVSNHWAEGGAGARALAEAVVASCESFSDFKFLYDLKLAIEEKIAIISREIYGADGIELSDLARTQLETYTRQGYNDLPSTFVRLLEEEPLRSHLPSSQSAWPRLNIHSPMMHHARAFRQVSLRIIPIVLRASQLDFHRFHDPCP
jgi:hypothetical protein